MIKFYTSAFSILLLSSVQAQYCTAVGPSTTADSNLQSFNLSGESATAITFTGCPGVAGLDDQTFAESVVLNAGTSYTAYAQFGTCGGNYYGVGQAWIDYNQNQVFESSESIGTWSGTPPTALSTWGFNVPAGAISGTTRLRVVQFEGGALPIDPCAVFTWGSTTDFTVQIGGGMDCSGYLGQSTASPRPVSALPYSENYNNSVCYYNVMPVYGSPDVFYRILPVQLGAQYITISLCGSAIDTYLSVLDADGNVLYYNDDNAACGTSSKIHFNAGTHDTLYAVVQGWGYAVGAYSISIEEELAGISENSNSANFELYPNPANDRVKISVNEVNALVQIHDLSGKLVYTTTIQNQQEIDLSDLGNGTYLVTVLTEKGTSTQKLVQQ